MFSAKIIAVTFISTFFGIFLVEFLENKKKFRKIFQTVLLIFIIFSLYNFLAGLNLMFGWEDPLFDITPEQQGRAAARRGGGIILLIISFWPYILTFAGAYLSWLYIMIFKKT